MDKLLDSAFFTQLLLGDVKEIIGTAHVDLDDESVRKDLIDFLSKRIAGNSGILTKSGFDLISEYNDKFKYEVKDKKGKVKEKVDIFKNADIVDCENPMLLEKLDDVFSKDALGDLNKIELLISFAQMTNRIAKIYEQKAEELKENDPNLYKIFEINVYPELTKENYEAYTFSEDGEVKEDIYSLFLSYDEESDIKGALEDNNEYYDKYKKCIEKIKEVLQKFFTEKGTNYEVNDEVLKKYMEYRTYIKAREDAYSMKARSEEMCIYEVAKENIEHPKSKKYIQYIADDIKNKDKGSDFQYVYCLAIDGYSDTFELHTSEDLIKGAIEVIDNDIQNGTIVQNTNGLGGQVKNYTMPLIMEYPRFKTILPRRLPEKIVKNMGNLYTHAGKVGGKLLDFMTQAMSITDFTEKNLKVYDNKRGFNSKGVYDAKKVGGDE